MKTQTIQRQYNEVVAPHYDLDPQEVTGRSLDRAVEQVQKHKVLSNGQERLKVFDVGAGTGMFLSKLKALGGQKIRPFALDLSAKMIENACRKMPDLTAAVDDGANLDAHFLDETFDLISTHFITGFVPLTVLAPKIWNRLEEGGYWSFIGGTKGGYPALQAKANSKLLRWFLGARPVVIEDVVCIPAGQDEVVRTLETQGFTIVAAETFRPQLEFRNLEQFMEFGYRGGWLTPFIEEIGLHKAGALTRFFMNWFVFPVHDHHDIVIVLARKGTGDSEAGEAHG
jgi:SAM-dependent methyltransferase